MICSIITIIDQISSQQNFLIQGHLIMFKLKLIQKFQMYPNTIKLHASIYFDHMKNNHNQNNFKNSKTNNIEWGFLPLLMLDHG